MSEPNKAPESAKTAPAEATTAEKSLKASEAENFLRQDARITLSNFHEDFNVGTVVNFLKKTDPTNPDLALLEEVHGKLNTWGASKILNEKRPEDFNKALQDTLKKPGVVSDQALQTKIQQAWEKYQHHQDYFYEVLSKQKVFNDARAQQREGLGSPESSNDLENTAKAALKNFKNMPLVLQAATIGGLLYLTSLVVTAEPESTMGKLRKTLLYVVGGSLLGAATYQIATGKSAYKGLKEVFADRGMPDYWSKTFDRSKVQDSMVMRESVPMMGGTKFRIVWEQYLYAKNHNKDEVAGVVNPHDMSPKDVFIACEVLEKQYGDQKDANGHAISLDDKYKNKPSATWRDVVFSEMVEHSPDEPESTAARLARQGITALSNPGQLYDSAKEGIGKGYKVVQTVTGDVYGAGKVGVKGMYDAGTTVASDLVDGGKRVVTDAGGALYEVGGALHLGAGWKYAKAKFRECFGYDGNDKDVANWSRDKFVSREKVVSNKDFPAYIKSSFNKPHEAKGFDKALPGKGTFDKQYGVYYHEEKGDAIYIIAQKPAAVVTDEENYYKGIEETAQKAEEFLKNSPKYGKNPKYGAEITAHLDTFAKFRGGLVVEGNNTVMMRMPIPGSEEYELEKTKPRGTAPTKDAEGRRIEQPETFGKGDSIDYFDKAKMTPLQQKQFRLHFMVDESQPQDIKNICTALTERYRSLSTTEPNFTRAMALQRPFDRNNQEDLKYVLGKVGYQPHLRAHEENLKGIETELAEKENEVARKHTKDTAAQNETRRAIQDGYGLMVRLATLGDTKAIDSFKASEFTTSGGDFTKQTDNKKLLEWYEKALISQYPPPAK